MLGRGVAERLGDVAPDALVDPAVVEFAGRADLFVLNLECCISERGEPWPDPTKPFFFRAPPSAVETLLALGVDVVTLANNHALDFGEEALLDTIEHLDRAGIAHVGAGADVEQARAPAIIERDSVRVAVIGVADHPADFDAERGHPGIAYAAVLGEVPPWLQDTIAGASRNNDVVVVTPHWGPNMTPRPVPHVRKAAPLLVEAGATLVAGHSAHVFQGVEERVLYDLGDFLDDYAVDPTLRNDLGLLWLVEVGPAGPKRLEALPLALDYCYTRAADGEDAAWVRRRFRELSAEFGTEAEERDGLLVIDWS
jgi:poly-gamma-glutamate synthesis protein (capsule biosynthesis protein)